MANTPKSVFQKFLRDIEPSSTTKSSAKSAHERLRSVLKSDERFKHLVVKILLSGSYKRNTAIRPREKNGTVDRPDVDVIVIVDLDLSDGPAELIELLFDVLDDEYDTIRKQQRSVRVETSAAVVDVVPIIAPNGEDGTLYIADRKLEEWLETNPPRHTTWTEEVNDAAGNRFKPLVKMCKWWRRERPTSSKKPKGFVVECIVAENMDRNEKHYGELFVGTLESIVSKYSTCVSLGVVPHIDDPGVPGNSVTAGMTAATFKSFYERAEAHAKIGREALEEEDDEKATKLWRKIFGERFPKIENMSKGLTAATSSVGAASFPDRPVRPNRPGGFA